MPSILKKTAILLVFGVIFLVNVRTVELGDFWWHISTGKWIVENHSIPDSDPFSFTVDVPSDEKAPILKSYWLAQVLIYAAYHVTGYDGLVILRALFFAGVFALLYLIIRGYGLSVPLSLSLILLAVPGLGSYNELRPQVSSFFFALMTFYLIETIMDKKEKAYRTGLLLPLTMLIWSNMHGGYIIGFGMIIIAMIFMAVRDIRLRADKSVVPVYVVMVLAIMACALNPASLSLLKSIDLSWLLMKTDSSGLQSTRSIHEYYPPVRFYEFTGDKRYFYSLCLLLGIFAASCLAALKRLNYFHLVLSALFISAALNAFRFGAFFFLFSAAFAGYNLALLFSGKWIKGKAAVWVLPIVLACSVLYIERPFIKMGFAEPYVPVKPVEFIKRTSPPKELLGTYEWGGYLIWQLYPEYRTFIDGRVLSEQAYREYNDMALANFNAGELLDSYHINTVLTYTMKPYAKGTLPITFYMLRSDEWQPVYWDPDALIFVRKDLAKNPIKKQTVWTALISRAQGWVMTSPRNAEAHALLGEIYYHKKLYSYARQSFQQALELDPRNKKALRYMTRMP
jgi:tetratricopeptide (TPR) repeat protein